MTLVTLEKVTRRFAEENVLDGLSLRVDEGDRIGVVGDNGAGKTTMARILAGADEPDTGLRNARKDLRVAFGEQMPRPETGLTVLEFVLRGTGEHDALQQRMRDLEVRMASHDEAAIRDYGTLQAAFEAGGGYDRRHRVEKVLGGLGFTGEDLAKDVGVLSGGERSRTQLAVLMTTPADLLILDEPTNHLDLEGIAFVEDFVQRHPGAVIAISHDRAFLDRAVTSIVDVADGIATRWKGNFTHYARQRDLALLTQARQFKNQSEFLEKEMEYIRRNMAGRNSAQAKGRLKRLMRVQLLEKPHGKRTAMRLTFGEGGGTGRTGQAVIEAEGLVVRAGDRTLLDRCDLRVWFGEVLVLLGRNGAGKTTLLEVLAGLEQPAGGKLRRVGNLRIGYFSQEKTDLPREGSVLQALQALDRTVDERTLRDHLALFLFCGDDVDKPVEGLSGGEKQRLGLALLTRSRFDLLCLDEPTNHLDVAGTEGLEQALKEYPGTVVLVTHDRRLVEEVADRVAWLEDGRLRTYDGGLAACIEDLAERKAAARAAETAAKERGAKATAGPDGKSAAATRAIETGKIRNPLLFARLEERIFGLEDELRGVREGMLQPEHYASAAKMKELQQRESDLVQRLAAAYAEWENWQ